jgi:hypothetical protein
MEQVNAGLCAVAEIIDTDEYSEVAKAYAEAKRKTRFPGTAYTTVLKRSVN